MLLVGIQHLFPAQLQLERARQVDFSVGAILRILEGPDVIRVVGGNVSLGVVVDNAAIHSGVEGIGRTVFPTLGLLLY